MYYLKSHFNDLCWCVVHKRTLQLIFLIWLVDDFSFFIYLIKVFKRKLFIKLPNIICVSKHTIKHLKYRWICWSNLKIAWETSNLIPILLWFSIRFRIIFKSYILISLGVIYFYIKGVAELLQHLWDILRLWA